MRRDLGEVIKRAADVPQGMPDLEAIRRRGRQRRLHQLVGAGVLSLLLLGGLASLPSLVSDRVGQGEAEPPSSLPSVASPTSRSDHLVVVDPGHDNGSGRILVIDRQSGTVRRSISTGSSPQMTASRDSRLLFIASNEDVGQPVLRSVDLTSGETSGSAALPVSEGYGLLAMIPGTFFPTMSTSADGRLVYVMVSRIVGPDMAEYAFATFDTSQNSFLPELAEISGCGNSGGPHVAIGSNRLVVFCLTNSSIMTMDIDESGNAATRTTSLPVVADPRTDANGNSLGLEQLAGGVVTPEGESAYALTQGGEVFEIDLASQTVERQAKLPLPNTQYVSLYQAVLSATSDSLFIGVGELREFNRLQSSSIVGFDTRTWEEIGRLALPQPGSAVFSGPLKDKIYVIDNGSGAISVVDSVSLDVSRVLGPFGRGLTVGEALP